MIADAATATQILSVILVALTLFVALGSSLVVRSRTQGLSESVTALQTANGGLRDIITDLERKQITDNAECDRRLLAQEVTYASEINNLKGKLEVLTGDLAERLVAAAITAARKDAE